MVLSSDCFVDLLRVMAVLCLIVLAFYFIYYRCERGREGVISSPLLDYSLDSMIGNVFLSVVIKL